MEDRRIVIDHADNIVVSGEIHYNNLNVLRSLHIGMLHLAEFTRHREIEKLAKYGKGRLVGFSDFGSHKELLLGCMFDWFAINLVSYVRTIKLIHLMDEHGWDIADLKQGDMQRQLREAYSSYIARVAPDVLQWRNKIAAHRAVTDPRSDSLALLTYSTFPTVAYRSPYYRVGELKLSMGDGSVTDLSSWSLTEMYDKLTLRYWPDRKLTELDC